MYGSASTWLFNVVRLLLEQANGAPPRVNFFSGAADFSAFGQPGITDLIKSHELEDEATILELAKRAHKIFITVRDPRDAVTSLIQARSHSFSRAVNFVEQSARLCAALRADSRARLWRYETGFFDAPETISQAAAHLGLAADMATSQAIFTANRRAAVEQLIAALPARPNIMQDDVSGDLLDPQTQWHTHHAGRSGEIGRWQRFLTPEQVSEIEQRIPYFWA